MNETLAAHHFPGVHPVGRVISRVDRHRLIPMELIGVVQDVKHRSPRDAPRPVLDAPAAQETFFLSPATVVVRARSTPARLIDPVRQTVAENDPDLAVFDAKPLAQQVAETIWAERLLARIGGIFGAMALLLAGIGVFGTLSYTVARRTREIGIRIAIGADTRQVRRSVVMSALLLCLFGLLLGIPGAIAAVRYAGSLLYGVGPSDWKTFAAAAALLTATAAVSAYAPARRASRVDPLEVLLAE